MTKDLSTALGLGGNLGPVPSTFAQAVIRIRTAGLRQVTVAPFYRTAAVDCEPGAPPFINTVITGRWPGTPSDLLRICQETERALGRPGEHSSRQSRPIDIDILLLNSLTLDTPELTVPHPRLEERLFVLAPLTDVAPHWRIPPHGHTVKTQRDRLLRTTPPDWGSRVRIPASVRQTLRQIGRIAEQ